MVKQLFDVGCRKNSQAAGGSLFDLKTRSDTYRVDREKIDNCGGKLRYISEAFGHRRPCLFHKMYVLTRPESTCPLNPTWFAPFLYLTHKSMQVQSGNNAAR